MDRFCKRYSLVDSYHLPIKVDLQAAYKTCSSSTGPLGLTLVWQRTTFLKRKKIEKSCLSPRLCTDCAEYWKRKRQDGRSCFRSRVWHSRSEALRWKDRHIKFMTGHDTIVSWETSWISKGSRYSQHPQIMVQIEVMKTEVTTYQTPADSIKPLVERKDDKGQDTFDISDWW